MHLRPTRLSLAFAGPLSLAWALSACDDQPLPVPPDTCATAKVGQICTVAGTGAQGFDGGGNHRLASWLYWPNDIGFDADDKLHIVDWNNHRIRRVVADQTLQTIVGSEEPGDGDPAKADMKDGAQGTDVKLNHPTDLYFPVKDTPIAKKGDLLLMAWHNHRLRTWNPVTKLVHVTCGAVPGFGGDGQAASQLTKFNQPSKLTQDASGNTYLIDMRNWRIRKVAANGIVSTIAGNGKPGGSQAIDQTPVKATEASFLFFDPAEWGNPTSAGGGLAVSPDGKTLFIADTENHRIRALDLASGMLITVAGSGENGCKDGDCKNGDVFHPHLGTFAGDAGPALAARLNRPHDLAFGSDDRLYFADTGNHRVRAIDLQTGLIATVAGTGEDTDTIAALPGAKLGDGKLATQARLHQPKGIAFDKAGNLYIADTYNHRIRKVIK